MYRRVDNYTSFQKLKKDGLKHTKKNLVDNFGMSYYVYSLHNKKYHKRLFSEETCLRSLNKMIELELIFIKPEQQ